MKPKITSVHLGYILGNLPLKERFRTAAKLGFNAVEFPFPYEIAAEEYASLLEQNGLRQISIGAPSSDYKEGEPGFSLTPSLASEFDRSIDTVTTYAKTIGCENVHIFAGARSPDVSEGLAWETYCQRLGEAHDRLRREGLRVVIEAVNSTDFVGYFMNRLDKALSAVETSGRPDIGIILDVYHASINREDPVRFLRDHDKSVAHVQLADFPGRHEPGTGTFNFERLFAAMAEIAYSGSVGLEYVPTRSVLDGVPLAEMILGARQPAART